jgi:F-type H+-transporting ATPase subunit alpha
VKTLNQAERHPMPVEDQVIQIYAATNGYLDRIVVDKVDKFLEGLTESVRANEPELLNKIAGGDWSDETQKTAEEAVHRYAEDFGFDLDEEGHPLEEGDELRPQRPREAAAEEPGEPEEQKEEEPVPA